MNGSENQSNLNSPKQPKKKSSPIKSFLWGILSAFLFAFLFAVGLGLVFHSQVEGWLIQSYKPALTAEDIRKNQNTKGNFDFDSVEAMDLQKVASARANSTKLNVIGLISVPKADMNIAITPGVDNYSLALAAGTLNEGQEMGKGNYALAAHHMVSQDALFGPIATKVKVKQKVYLTDLDKVYEYKLTKRELIAATDVDVLKPVEGKKLITLITCDATGDERWMAQGKFVKSYDIDKAPKEALKGFQDAADVKKNF